ncbi:MAG: LysM peptidoglycan-binding domain-containing protein [Bacteroidales bacterium]|nr:LysM peptidoglycan-binding domain-containing protein [Bacteroidales bacterium]
MDLAQFFRVIKNSLLLLIVIPLLLALVVFYFTRNQDQVFESEAIIYTGITTGYSIESTAQRPTDYFSTSAQFDNLINMINARQTISETALMLFAQNLSLESYNPQYISNENLDKLHKTVPKHVKDMVVKNGKAGMQREKEEQIKQLEHELRNLEQEYQRQRDNISQDLHMQTTSDSPDTTIETNEYGQTSTAYPQSTTTSYQDYQTYSPPITTTYTSRTHTVKPGETLLIISQKYGVSMNKLRELNKLHSQDLRSGQKLIIESTASPVTTHLPTTATPEIASGLDEDFMETDDFDDDLDYMAYRPATEYYTAYTEPIDLSEPVYEKDPIIPRGIRQDDFNKTLQNLTNYYYSSDTNYLYGLLHYGSSKHYSIKSIQTLQIYRINNSDLVRLVYQSDDPGICQQTLKIIANIFVKNYKLLKVSQADMVVAYFRSQVDSADRQLQATEDKLLRFNRRNNIINYQEQTKYIASQKEELDVFYQNEQVRMAQSSAALRELETKLTRRDSIYLKSDLINQRRKEYAEVTEKILLNELAEDYDKRIGDEIAKLRQHGDHLRDEIRLYVDQLYLYSHSTQGVPISSLLTEWLRNALSYEEAKASLVVLSRRKLDFVRTYQRFAPLGAMLKRIEREMTIAEQTYLEMLRSLNLAKMRQQNLQMATNIHIVDPPYFPLSPKSSKAKYLVIAAFLIGFFFVLFIILLLEYFDTSVKSPAKVSSKTGLKFAGAYPYLSPTVRMKDATLISNRLIEMIIQSIQQSIRQSPKQPVEKPYLVLFFSTQPQVGKTLIISKIAHKLRTFGDRVLVLNYADAHSEAEEGYDYSYTYQMNAGFSKVDNLNDLINSKVLRRENYDYDYLLLELPSVMYHNYPMGIITLADASLLIIKATNTWNKADQVALETILELAKNKPMVVLNEAEGYAIEEIISGIQFQKTDTFWQRLKRFLLYPTRLRIQMKES